MQKENNVPGIGLVGKGVVVGWVVAGMVVAGMVVRGRVVNAGVVVAAEIQVSNDVEVNVVVGLGIDRRERSRGEV